jgi:hypothetical protein
MATGKISSIEDLRDHALLTIQKLANQEIDTAEAGVTGKLCESVISTVKAELEYARMTDQEPRIPFMNGNGIKGHKMLEGTVNKKLIGK